MRKISDEELTILTEYAVKAGQVSIPQIQQHFGWSYSKAKKGVDLLVDKKKLKFKKGIVFTISDTPKPKSYADEDRIREEFRKALEERFASYEEEPFVLCQEEASIKSYIQIMDNLNLSAYGAKPIKEPPQDGVLPDKYEKLALNVKQLVNVAIKCAEAKKSARFGLFQSSLQWRKKRKAQQIYQSAINFVDGLTEREFRIIKRNLTDG